MTAALPAAKWPFMFVSDDQGRATGWMLIHAPVITQSRQRLFATYRSRGFAFAGMTSFLTFPRFEEDDPLDYEAVCEAWCHCFREPGRFLSTKTHVRLALSDFTNPDEISPQLSAPYLADIPQFDFVYASADQAWKLDAKNWELGRRCVLRLCDELKLRGLVLGGPADGRLAGARITRWPSLPRALFLAVLSRARFLLIPNATDPSPRVLAEALCLDVPIVVNRAILGGWHYVTDDTGEFFSSEDDVLAAAAACLSRTRAPRAWFQRTHGPQHAGQRLQALLAQVDPSLAQAGPLRIGYEPPVGCDAAQDGLRLTTSRVGPSIGEQ